MVKLAKHIFETLHREGIEHSFGIPGDYALALYDVLAESPIQPVVMTHEPSAGLAADAYSRIRGLGLAVVTYGVGGLNMVNAVAGAYAEKSPLIVLSGAPGVREREERPLLHHKVKTFETQRRVYEEVTVYAAALDNPATADMEIHRAVDYARTFKRPVYLEIPRDMVDVDIAESDHRPPPVKRTNPLALEAVVSEVIEMLTRAESPVLIADVEVHRFQLQGTVVALAEHLGVPVSSTLLGKSAFPEGHPQYIGVYVGDAGDPRVRETVESSDCVLMLGVFMTDINMGMFTAELDPARTIYADVDRIVIKHHEYSDVAFEDFIRALQAHPDLPQKSRSDFAAMQPRVAPSNGAITVSGVLHELNAFIDEETVLVTDVGDALFAAADIQTREGTSFLCPAFYAGMGFAVPGVIGAQLADPGRRAVALVGDGAFQMTGLEVITARRLGLNPIILVLNNGVYGSLRSMGHKGAPFVDIGETSYAELGESLGGRGFVVRTGEELRMAFGAANETDTFSIVDIRISPDDGSPALRQLGELFARTLQG